jgi:hypothetical protein
MRYVVLDFRDKNEDEDDEVQLLNLSNSKIDLQL